MPEIIWSSKELTPREKAAVKLESTYALNKELDENGEIELNVFNLIACTRTVPETGEIVSYYVICSDEGFYTTSAERVTTKIGEILKEIDTIKLLFRKDVSRSGRRFINVFVK